MRTFVAKWWVELRCKADLEKCLEKRRVPQKGVALVEFVIVFPVFLLLMLGGADVLYLMYNAITIQFLANEAAREASVGPVNSDTGQLVDPDSGEVTDEYSSSLYADTIKRALRNRAQLFGLDSEDLQITVCPSVERIYATQCWIRRREGSMPGELITVTAKINYQSFIYPLKTIPLTGRGIGRMQEFGS